MINKSSIKDLLLTQTKVRFKFKIPCQIFIKVTEASPNTSANFGDSFIQFQASDSEAPQLDESLTEILSKKIEKTEVSQTKEIPQAQNIPDSGKFCSNKFIRIIA